MKRDRWTPLLHALVLIRLGQELGTDSKAARLIHDFISILATFAGIAGD